MPNNSVRIHTEVTGNAPKEINSVKDAWTAFQKKGKEGLGLGVGLAAGAAGFALLDGAISKTTEFLTDSVAKAREEEAGIAKLDTALRANVKGWDGNRDSIERVIAAREKLAFSDGEQRDSLALLVARTHDATKALDLQGIAMDFARLKGVDLATSSELIGKVYGGNLGLLQRYGIAVEKGATSTEALATIQKLAAGQAKAFGDSAEGAAQGAEIAIEDLQEEIGQGLLPVVKEVATTVRDDLVPALQDGVKFVKENQDAIEFLGDAFGQLVDPVGNSIDFMVEKQDEAKQAAIEASLVGADAWATGSERVMSSMAAVGDASHDMDDDVRTSTNRITRRVKNMYQSYDDFAEFMLGKYNDDIDKALGIHEARVALNNAKTAAERVKAYEQIEALGDLSQTDYENWINSLKKMAKGTKGQVHAAYMAAIADVRALRDAADKPVIVDVRYQQTGSTSLNKPKAIGGAVEGGNTYLVGEKGPELFSPSMSGYIVPNNQLQGDSTPTAPTPTDGGSPSMNFYLTVSTPILTPGGAEALAQAIVPHVTKAMQRQQLIPRR